MLSQNTNMSEVRRKNSFYEKHVYGEKEVLETLEIAEKFQNKNVLIAGSGAGREFFRSYFHGSDKITAIDQSERAIKFIKKHVDRLDLEKEKIDLVCADLTEIDIEESEYDLVVCNGVLHHIEDTLEVMIKLKKACKDSGEVQFSVYNSRSPTYYERKLFGTLLKLFPLDKLLSDERKRSLEWRDKWRNPYWKGYSKKEIEDISEEAGLKIEELQMTGRIFGEVFRWFTPRMIRNPLFRRLPSLRWMIHVRATKAES
jgi:2-polyprenyl-3-methyl-5-hydroxy-6-metoxy-1,4-benzoquinol methylase